MTIPFLSFFSGAMGLDLGLELEGFETILTSEIDPFCQKTIKMNKPNLPVLGDIRDYSAEDIREYSGLTKNDDVVLMVGGPPCQAFSTAGKRKAFEDERGNVFLKYIELILSIRPRYAIIENVRGLLSTPLKHRPHNQRGEGFPPLSKEEQPGGALFHIISLLEGAGYGISFNLYNSANMGSPQVRERVIIVCDREGSRSPYLTPTHSERGEDGLKRWRVLSEVISDLEGIDHDFIPFPEKRLKYYRMLTQGQNWKDLPVDLQKEALGKSFYAGGGKTGFLRRLAWDKPSPTIVTNPTMPATDLAHPSQDRPLSVQEYKRIQEFPDEWMIAGSIRYQYRQIGNAVPLSLGRAVGRLMKELLNGNNNHVEDFKHFRYSRYRGTDDQSWKKKYAPELIGQQVIPFSK